MPLNDYLCPNGHKTEHWHHLISQVPKTLPCPECGSEASKQISVPRFMLSWALAPIDSSKDIWEGTALEGTDGVNELTYESKKLQLDMGKR